MSGGESAGMGAPMRGNLPRRVPPANSTFPNGRGVRRVPNGRGNPMGDVAVLLTGGRIGGGGNRRFHIARGDFTAEFAAW